MPHSTAAPPLSSVRTQEPVAEHSRVLCPVCKAAPLRRPQERGGRQTVCSPRCRARRWRAAQAGQLAEREQQVCALLLTAQESIEAALDRLRQPS